MKRIIIITVLSLFPFVCNAQNDYGLYVRHPHLGNMDASYQFFYSFGYFTYCTDEYNDLTGHICISGNFKIQNDSIFFFDLSIEIPVLTELSRTSSKDIREEWIIQDSTAIKRQRPNASNFWSLIGNGNRREIKVDPSKKFSASFFRHEKDEYIEIDGEKYYGVYDPSE